MTYADAMRRYGSDKPDLRFGLELVELTDYFADTPFRVFQAAYVGAVVMPGGAVQPRKQLDAWQEWAKQRGARGLAYVLVGDDGELGGPVAKNLSETERAGLAEPVGAEPGDCVFFAAGRREDARGAARRGPARGRPALRARSTSRPGRSCGSSTRRCSSRRPSDGSGDVAVAGAWTAVHHPFTSPNAEWVDTLRQRPRRGAGLRVRHRLQRQRDRRRVDPYPPPRRPAARLRRPGALAGGGAGEVRLPARGVRLRAAAARRHRLRLGPHLHAARRAPSRCATSSRSRRPAAASTR